MTLAGPEAVVNGTGRNGGPPGMLSDAPPLEEHVVRAGRIERTIRHVLAPTVVAPVPPGDPVSADRAYLMRRERPNFEGKDPLRLVDLFCGCGSLTLGALEAARSLHRGAEVKLALDQSEDAVQVYRDSLGIPDSAAITADATAVLDRELGHRTSPAERELLDGLGSVDLAVAGPPCQGHSALNNHSRHDDDRNDLYLRVARFAELVRPRFLLLENVGSIVRDKRRALARTAAALEALGYAVDHGVVNMNELGVPQLRRRHVLVAAAEGERNLTVEAVVERQAVPSPGERTVGWAIADLAGIDGQRGFDQSSSPSPDNAKRMAWLHERPDRYDLPNRLRPPCHKDDHTYVSMYGQLRWDRPAQTVTSGYGSMGQGRYVHPGEPRTLTPHEAARLQLIPDFFDFGSVARRGSWAEMIGNAAPMKLSYAFAVEMFRPA